ncbi:hypothetical protein [Paraconexibacter algicola]|uniref:Uncharacterized protein n=1 Tax=Paraconexibacter algicola TaxID=2133960 RepID=A0A2T4UCY4_9ACTN|nr:hypothetical protein [Paraconexibacter algicola]PTL55368.1 hypothetical protein C7Y72_17040 [Paraconexibacter algicola]
MTKETGKKQAGGDAGRPWWHWTLGFVGGVVIIGSAVWFGLSQYVDGLKPCEVTTAKDVETTKCAPPTVTVLLPVILVGLGLLFPFLDEIEVPGFAKFKRRQLRVEGELETHRSVLLGIPDQLEAAAEPGAQPPPVAGISDEALLLQIWNSALGPAQQLRAFGLTPGTVTEIQTALDDPTAEAELAPVVRDLVARLRKVGIRDANAAWNWAQTHRRRLELLSAAVESVSSNAASAEAVAEALAVAHELATALGTAAGSAPTSPGS